LDCLLGQRYDSGEGGAVARQSGWWSATIRMTFGNRDEVIMFALIVAGKR
jgi:hypothetical protein